MAATPERAKYLQVADDLRRKILDGTYGVGDPLPSTAQLMNVYGVSVTVVRAAVKELQTEGVAVGQPGKAVYVQREPSPAPPNPEHQELTQQIVSLRQALEDLAESLDVRLARLERMAGKGHSDNEAREV